MKKANVGILGGGLSGLIAGYELCNSLKNDVHITILEKNEVLGGRIFTKTFKNAPMELGAMFYIDNGRIQHLLKSLNLEQGISLHQNNFISLLHNNNIFNRNDFFLSELSKEEKKEFNELKPYIKKLNFDESYKFYNFEQWYKNKIGHHLIPLWNRMLMSLGVKDLQSINAYFGLTLVYVLINGHNFLHKSGLKQLINKLHDAITTSGGEIITGAEVIRLKQENSKYKVIFKKEKIEKERTFDKIISAVKPNDLTNIFNIKALHLLNEIKGHPLAVYVVQSNKKVWNNTWGLILTQEHNPIYILLDWKNVETINKNAPFLIIASGGTTQDEILEKLKALSPDNSQNFTIIDEKKWSVGLHQQDEYFYEIRKKILKELPDNFYLAGDWMTLPALEGAVISGMKSAKSLIKAL